MTDEYIVKIAKTIEEAKRLVEAGFEYVTGEYCDGGKIFRRRKQTNTDLGCPKKNTKPVLKKTKDNKWACQ
jgi:hypothetical protein